MADEQAHRLDRLSLSDVGDRRVIQLGPDQYLATDRKGGYILSPDPDQLFIGREIPAKRACNPYGYSRYIKIDLDDKIHLVGIGIMIEFEEEKFWMAYECMVGSWDENSLFFWNNVDKIYKSRALVFEIPKELLCRWKTGLLSDEEKEKAEARTERPSSIFEEGIRRLLYSREHGDGDCLEHEVDDILSELLTILPRSIFSDMLADMLADDAERGS